MAHARGRSEGGQSRREDADDDLQNGLPSFFLHGVDGLRVKEQKSSQITHKSFLLFFVSVSVRSHFVCDF